jgi:hypothetical protein
MDFSKWRPEILHEIEYLVFHNYFFLWKKKFEKHDFFQNIVNKIPFFPAAYQIT